MVSNLPLHSAASSSGVSSRFTYDVTPDSMSFGPRELSSRNEASDIGVQFRSRRTVSQRDKVTADLAAMVSHSVASNRRNQTGAEEDEAQIVPFTRPQTGSLLTKTFAANADGSLFEVTEQLLIRDVLMVFQGIDGKLLKFDSSADGYRITTDIGVLLPVRDLVYKLAELGWLFRRVRKFLDARAGDKALGLVGQSFCAAINKELTEYYRLVAVLEAQENQEETTIYDDGAGLTLRRLVIWTYDPLSRMKALATLVDICKGLYFPVILSATYRNGFQD